MHDSAAPRPRLIREVDEAVKLLRAGEVVALPTETVYGLAARADVPEAVARIFSLKGRPASNPLILHVSDTAMLADWTSPPEDRAMKLAEVFWPGPLTMVLPALSRVSRRITAGQDTVAVRLPAHPLMRAVIAEIGQPLVAPSANLSTRLSPTTALHVASQFHGHGLAILDGGPCAVGLESTIVSVLPGRPVALLRPGTLGASALAAVLGEPVAEGEVTDSGVRVPGQMRLHYAPRQPLTLLRQPLGVDLDDPRCGWVTPGIPLQAAGPVLDLGSEPGPFARDLYAALHDLEDRDVAVIRVILPPDGAAWRAVHDRLGRASAGRDRPA
ncbi:MAG: threonylcarbamoyl-AMP synthase [Candidatus Sericytochromatia bacterium]|nr:threonylcarbamoyl-AMP synthase [Candidatus Tanganyikabacteria bacterium]